MSPCLLWYFPVSPEAFWDFKISSQDWVKKIWVWFPDLRLRYTNYSSILVSRLGFSRACISTKGLKMSLLLKKLFRSVIVFFFLYFQVPQLYSQARWANLGLLICSFCRRIFQSKAVLAAHVRSHTGERPYICPYCEKSFTRKQHLMTHSRLHTGVRPYECHICNRTFSDSSNFRKHKYTRHNLNL
jgi:DNA-directed RNA polymerase subunit RPC12/RpoP